MKIILAVVIIAVILAVIALAVVYTKVEKYVAPLMGFSILCDPKTMAMLNRCGLQDGLSLSMKLATFTQTNFGCMTFHGVFELPPAVASNYIADAKEFNCVFLAADNNMNNVRTIDFEVESCTFQGFCTALFENQEVEKFLQSLSQPLNT